MKPLPDSKQVTESLQKVSFFVRGFGKRHLTALCKYMKLEGFSSDLFTHVKISFCKFKFLQMMFPSQKMDLLWIFKHCLHLEGQKLLNDTFDASLDISYERALWYYNSLKEPSDTVVVRQRLLKYFFRNDPSEWIPLTVFPPILFEKKRMDLAFLPLKEINAKEVRETFFRFIIGLEVRELFIPPADILWKVGNQLYNDGGIVKKDYERASDWRSGFKYQYFLAQPLSPREVWLPDKFTKHNNLFWMTIGRQFLKNCKAYPVSDPIKVWEQIKGRLGEGCMRFDISGFGFQFPRDLLAMMASVIQELYPSDQMEICSSDFYEILDSVKVEKSWEILYPPRGIGLGYYEDLKTLVMIALLDKFDAISVYGDQGILRPYTFDAISVLQENNFILRDDKVEYQSYDTNGGMKWAGHGMFPDYIKRVKDVSNPLLGCFFSRHHWERKSSLFSFFEENKPLYKFLFKRIKRAYIMFFGHEFYEGDLDLSFYDGGINPYNGIVTGTSKSYIITEYLRPYEDTFFEVPFITPFKKRAGKIYPHGVSKSFQKERQESFKRFKPIDSSVFFYSKPRLYHPGKYKPEVRLIPDWADLLFLCNYGYTTGNFSYGLNQENLTKVAGNYSLSLDPLRTAARGGYEILDRVYSKNRPLSREWVTVLGYLETVNIRKLPYMVRVDLGLPPPEFGSEEMYKTTNLLEYVVKEHPHKKRKRSQVSGLSGDNQSIRNLIVNNIRSQIHNGIINSLDDIIPVFEDNLFESEQEYAADYDNMSYDYLDQDELL